MEKIKKVRNKESISKNIIELYIQNNTLSDLEKRELASYIGAYLRRHSGIYATIAEIYRYLNREMGFNQTRDRLKEALDSKDEKEALKILQDTVL